MASGIHNDRILLGVLRPEEDPVDGAIVQIEGHRHFAIWEEVAVCVRGETVEQPNSGMSVQEEAYAAHQ